MRRPVPAPSRTCPLITVELLHTPAEMAAAERLLQRVWSSPVPPVDVGTLVALAHSGNYVAGAYDLGSAEPTAMIGCTVGFFAAPRARSLHSHIAGVDPRTAGRGVGATMKHHQRTWCLEQGVTTMTWTFDPAIARNAYFNLAKLGVTVEAYLEDFYGPLDDGLNAGSPSDRLLVRWDLTTETRGQPPLPAAPTVLAVGESSEPRMSAADPAAPAVLVQVPADVEGLRRSHPALAARWRLALRQVLGARLSGGSWRIAAFASGAGYVLERAS